MTTSPHFRSRDAGRPAIPIASSSIPADAERREGVDHARGDRAALRAASIDIGKNETWTPEFLSLNPNGKIPAILDPDGPDGEPLGTVRIRRDPALPRGEDRQARYPTDAGAALRDDPVGVLPDGGGRADVRPARLSSTSSPAGRSRTSARSSAIAPRSSGCSACWRRGSTGRQWIMGDDYTIADISLLGWVRNLIGFYEARELVDFDISRMFPHGWSAAWHARRCSAASKFPSGRHNRNEKGRPRGRPFTRLAC